MPALIDPYKFAVSAVSWAAAVAARSPLAWYRLGDAALTTTPADSSGNGLTGSVVGTTGPTFAVTGLIAGDSDTAAQLVAANVQAVVANTSSTLHPKDFAMLVWIKSAEANKAIARDATGSAGYILDNGLLAAGHLAFRVSGTTFDTGVNTPLYDGSKHMLVWRVNGTVADLWLDGSKVYTTAITAAASRAAPVAAWRLGRNGTTVSSGNSISAIVDEWAIFSSLSDADVGALYAAGN